MSVPALFQLNQSYASLRQMRSLGRLVSFTAKSAAPFCSSASQLYDADIRLRINFATVLEEQIHPIDKHKSFGTLHSN